MAIDPEEANDSIVFGQFSGLRNTVAESRLAPDELARGLNVDIDDAFQPRRRRGYTQRDSGSFHSLRTIGGRTFAVRNGTLVRVRDDYTFVTLQTGAGTAPVAYVDVAGTTYFSSTSASGKILPDDTVESWGAVASAGEWHSPVVNPTATLPDLNGKLLGKPPMAEHLALYNGRIYLANGNVVWMTELYLYDYVDKTRNFLQFEDDVTGMIAVADGVYIGTAHDVWFIQGTMGSTQRTKMSPAGMVKHTAIEVPMDALALDSPAFGHAAMFMSSSGICVGLMSGVCYSLTQSKYMLPAAETGAAMYRREDGINHFVGVTDSAGDPTSTARFGDYVDAEIKRFEGA